MELSKLGLLEIAEHEGIVLGPYKDSVGVWTYGIGHTHSAGLPVPGTMPREDTRRWSDVRVDEELLSIISLFDTDLGKYEERVQKWVQTERLNQAQFDALVSFDYNTGGIYYKNKSGRYVNAHLVKAINSGDLSGDQFMGWVRPKEIIKRRKQEQALFRSGDYSANGDSITLWDALGDGRLKVRGVISGGDLVDLMKKAKTTRILPTKKDIKTIVKTSDEEKKSRRNLFQRIFGLGD